MLGLSVDCGSIHCPSQAPEVDPLPAAQAQPGLGLQDPLYRSVHAGLGKAAILHRLQQCAKDDLGIGWVQEHVDTGLNGLNSRFAAPVSSGQALHPHGVRYDQAPKPQFVPQGLFQYRGRKRGRAGGVFLQGRDGYVSRHDRHDTGPDHLPIGNPLDPFQPWAPHGNHRQRQMGIHLGIAVTRKMLGRCQHPGLLGSRDKCRTQTAHCLRVLSVGSNVDDRVGRIVVDIHHRRKHPVDPQASGFLGGDPSLPAGPLLRSGGPHGHVPGQGEGVANAEGGSALEVGSNQQGNRCLGLQSVDEDGRLVNISLE